MKQSVLDSLSSTSPGSERRPTNGLILFLGAILVLLALRLVIGFVAIPQGALGTANVIISVLFVATPILGFYAGGSYRWTFPKAWMLVLLGAAIQAGFWFLSTKTKAPVLAGTLVGVSQSGLLLWTFGVGSLLGLFLKDKNLLLPMAVFLALFDIWLVFAPEGVANQAVSGNGRMMAELLQKGGYQVPAPAQVSHGGYAQPLAYVGPADWLFLAMFFVALFRFNMRTRETLLAMIPTLAAYLLVVLLFGNAMIGPFKLGALPALLPIGAVILAVNWREFKLTKDEIVSTIAIVVIGAAIVGWRLVVSLNAPVQRPEPSQQAPSQGSPGPPKRQTPIYPA